MEPLWDDETPMHCAPTNDNRRWAVDRRDDHRDRTHDSEVHALRPAMLADFWRWIDESLSAVREMPHIRHAELPNPNPDRAPLDVGMADPTTVNLLVGVGQRSGLSAAGLYVGLVGQDPHARWRGLSGFYLAVCPGCDPSTLDLAAEVAAGLVGRAIDLVPPSHASVPRALHSKRNWFDGDRLLYVGSVSVWDEVDGWWEPLRGRLPRISALLVTGPVTASLGNMLLLDDLARDVQIVEGLIGGRAGWVAREGLPGPLAKLSGVSERTDVCERTVRSVRDVPIGWGTAFVGGRWTKPVPNLRRELAARAVGTSIRFLQSATGAVRLEDVLALNPA